MLATDRQHQDLISYCMGFAKKMLLEHGEFYPFGAAVDSEGRVTAVAADIGTEKPSPRELYYFLGDAFTAQAKSSEILAAAIASNVDVPTQYTPIYPDGLRIHVESSEYAAYVYVPYILGKSGLFIKTRTLSFAEPFSVEIKPQMFMGGANA